MNKEKILVDLDFKRDELIGYIKEAFSKSASEVEKEAGEKYKRIEDKCIKIGEDITEVRSYCNLIDIKLSKESHAKFVKHFMGTIKESEKILQNIEEESEIAENIATLGEPDCNFFLVGKEGSGFATPGLRTGAVGSIVETATPQTLMSPPEGKAMLIQENGGIEENATCGCPPPHPWSRRHSSKDQLVRYATEETIELGGSYTNRNPSLNAISSTTEEAGSKGEEVVDLVDYKGQESPIFGNKMLEGNNKNTRNKVDEDLLRKRKEYKDTLKQVDDVKREIANLTQAIHFHSSTGGDMEVEGEGEGILGADDSRLSRNIDRNLDRNLPLRGRSTHHHNKTLPDFKADLYLGDKYENMTYDVRDRGDTRDRVDTRDRDRRDAGNIPEVIRLSKWESGTINLPVEKESRICEESMNKSRNGGSHNRMHSVECNPLVSTQTLTKCLERETIHPLLTTNTNTNKPKKRRSHSEHRIKGNQPQTHGKHHHKRTNGKQNEREERRRAKREYQKIMKDLQLLCRERGMDEKSLSTLQTHLIKRMKQLEVYLNKKYCVGKNKEFKEDCTDYYAPRPPLPDNRDLLSVGVGENIKSLKNRSKSRGSGDYSKYNEYNHPELEVKRRRKESLGEIHSYIGEKENIFEDNHPDNTQHREYLPTEPTATTQYIEPLKELSNTQQFFNQRHTISTHPYSPNKSTIPLNHNVEIWKERDREREKRTVPKYNPNLTMFNNPKGVSPKKGGATQMHTDCSTPLKPQINKLFPRVLIGEVRQSPNLQPTNPGDIPPATQLHSGIIPIYLSPDIFCMVRLNGEVSVAELFDKLMHHLKINVKHAKRYILTYQVLPNKTEKSLYYNEKPIYTIKVHNIYIYIYRNICHQGRLEI